MNNKLKSVVCLITVLALSVCGIKADEQNNIDPNPLCTFLDSNSLNLMIWGAASNAENMDAPEKLLYWVNYSYIIYLPRDINSAVKEKDADNVTIDFFVAPTFNDATKEAALRCIKTILPENIREKVIVDQIKPISIKSATIKSAFGNAELNIQDDFLSPKYRSITISKNEWPLLLSRLKKGKGFSRIELAMFNDKKMDCEVLLKNDLKIVGGEAVLTNIEKITDITQKEQKTLVAESQVAKNETIEIIVPEKFKDMLIDTNSVRFATTIGDNEFGITNAYNKIGEIRFDKSLRKFSFDVDFSVSPQVIVEERKYRFLWWSWTRKVEKVIESKAELILDISYSISKEKEPDQIIKLTPTREGELSYLYDTKKYALKQLKIIDEEGNVTRLEKNGDYGRIHVKNEPGKINVQFK